MKLTTAYQNQASEQWRVMSAEKRAKILEVASENFLSLLNAHDMHSTQQASIAFNHVLSHAEKLDEIQSLNGATGESNELYHQARGLTVVTATPNAEKLPILVQVVSALLTGNQVFLNSNESKFKDLDADILNCLKFAKVSEDVFNLYFTTSADEKLEMLSQVRLAQVAIVGSVQDVQNVSEILSKTTGMLTQVIAITDQQQMSEIFDEEYIYRFCTERVRTINTTAIGGNASLIELGVE